MGVTTTYSGNYDSNNLPTNGRPFSSPIGPGMDDFSYTIPVTQTDDAGDVSYLTAIASGRSIRCIIFDSAALDSGTALDMDLVLRVTDKDGNHADEILYNAGTAFEAALAGKIVFVSGTAGKVKASASGYGHLIAKVNTAATTPVAGAITGIVIFR